MGLLQPTRLQFGVNLAPGIFQREVEKLVQGIPNIVCYLDDILIGGRTKAEHSTAVNEVLTHLLKYGLTVNNKKCLFFQTRMKFVN